MEIDQKLQAGMRFAMYSHNAMWMPEQSRSVEDGSDDKKMLETAKDFYKLTCKSTQAPFQERSRGVIRSEQSKEVLYNPNVIYTSRPVFKYTCPQKPKSMPTRKKHYKELWRNSEPLVNDTPLESFTVGRYYRDTKVGKSAVSVRPVDGRFIPTLLEEQGVRLSLNGPDGLIISDERLPRKINFLTNQPLFIIPSPREP